MLFDFHGLSGTAPPVAGLPVQLAMYLGIDTVSPTDPVKNAAGMGQFLAPAAAFDVNCMSNAYFNSVDIPTDASVEAHKASFEIGDRGIGLLPFENLLLRGTLSPDGSTFSGRMGGIATLCSFSLLGSPTGNGSMLGFLVNQFNLQPDIDIDGNGLDQVTGDGQDISSCKTPDGTVIPGATCACDPRIHDGFSAAFDFSAVPGAIVGLAME
jgi:hypothetical protein